MTGFVRCQSWDLRCVSVRLACALLLVAVALAACACGGGSSHAGSPCPGWVAAALGSGTRATPAGREVDRVTCVYRARRVGGGLVRVTVDTAPQAAVRWARWADERGQAYLGAPRAELPEVLAGIGGGAAWVPSARELVATGRGRLVTVVVLRAAPREDARATAEALARAALAG